MRYLLFIFTLAYSALSLAQKDTPVIINTPIMVEDAPPPPGSASSIFKVVEHMPEFREGRKP